MNAPKNACPHCCATRASECRAPDTCALCNCVACSTRRRLADEGGPSLLDTMLRAVEQIPKSATTAPCVYVLKGHPWYEAMRHLGAVDGEESPTLAELDAAIQRVQSPTHVFAHASPASLDAVQAAERRAEFERSKDPYALPPLPRITCE